MQQPRPAGAASSRLTRVLLIPVVGVVALLALSLLSPAVPARAVTTYATDTFNRTVANGWGAADTGGAWTVAGTPANWSVTPGSGSINVAANGQERAYLGAVSVQDVEIAAKIVLPRSSQNNRAIGYILGRDTGSGGAYYRIGVGQGTASTMIIRAQRSDGASISADLDTGLAAADGATVWLRVQFQGVNPTAIRARAWLDGTTEPTAWLLDITDANAAQQIAGDVGFRARNEDAGAAHTFAVRSFTATNIIAPPPPPPGPLAADTYARTATAEWNTADLGGFWTTFGTPPNWSVAPGSGAIAAAPNADERAYLSTVNTRDVDVTAQVVLPRSSQANNALAYVLGRFVAAYNPAYYAVGVGQGTGANVILRAQRSDGTAIGTDLDTGLPALDGVVLRIHVQFQGGSPTAIRARTWLDGTTEPSTWLLNTTDSNAAQQPAGAVGVRARNEDTAAAHTFAFRDFQATGIAVAKPPITPNPTDATLHHYLYSFPDQGIDIFDIDNGHSLFRHLSVPTSGVVGAAMSPATGMLYIEECVGNCETSTGGRILKYNLATDTVVWVAYLPFGVDNGALTNDGARFYSPDGENATDGLLHVLDGTTSASLAPITINMGGHNTVSGLGGTRVYSGGWQNGSETRYLHVINPATNTVTKLIGPLRGGVRPFTVNGVETFAFTTATNFLGFEVSSITTGQLLYSMPVAGFTWTTFVTNSPSHGITLSPDEREVYVMDGPNAYVHVFDVSGLPGSPPVQVADIPLSSLAGSHSACASRCQREGWLLHSRDGHYVWVGDSGDVIDTTTRTVVATLQSLRNTRNYLEIDWQNGAPVFTTTKAGLGYVGAPTATPTPTSTATGTATPTVTPSVTASGTATPTPASSTTATATASATSTTAATNTPTSTSTASATRTSTVTPTSSSTATSTPTATRTPTSTSTTTSTATRTPTATGTNTPTATRTLTTTATSTAAATNTPTETSTSTPTTTPTTSSTATAMASLSPTDTSTAVSTATETPVQTATNTPTPTETPVQTATDTPTMTETPVETATDTPTATESAQPTATATDSPTPTPTIDPALDTDGDGCPDARELGADWHTGGERDPADPWDFFDVPLPPLLPGHTTGARDRVINLGDVIGVLNYVGTSAANPSTPNFAGAMYGSDINANGVPDGQEYDRGAGSDASKPWRSGPPRGFVAIGSAIVALGQVGTDCS